MSGKGVPFRPVTIAIGGAAAAFVALVFLAVGWYHRESAQLARAARRAEMAGLEVKIASEEARLKNAVQKHSVVAELIEIKLEMMRMRLELMEQDN